MLGASAVGDDTYSFSSLASSSEDAVSETTCSCSSPLLTVIFPDLVMYPSFSEVDYCIRRQKGDAELIMLMNSSQDVLYVYICTR